MPARSAAAWRPSRWSRAERRRILRLGRHFASRAVGSDRWSAPALYGLDEYLKDVLPATGVFVEAGANDGYTQSNTFALGRRGWTGLLVEPFPHLAAFARRLRPEAVVVQAALVPPDLDGNDIDVQYADLMSTVSLPGRDVRGLAAFGRQVTGAQSGAVRCTGRTLSDLIDWAGIGPVDFLSLDLEGYEAPALRGLDLDRHRPTVILVEANHPDEVDQVLSTHYELVDRPTPRDRLYRARAAH